MELTGQSKETLAAHQGLLRKFEARASARDMVVPVKDEAVRRSLRALREPVCLFGEDRGDRRARLREEMLKCMARDGELPEALRAVVDEGEGGDRKSVV